MDSLNGKVLCLFTTGYPFGLQVETFIDSELPVMSSRFETVYIFPTIYETETIQRVLPPNFEVVKLKSDWGKHSSRLFKKNFLFIIKVLTDEFLNSKNKSVFLSNWKKYKNVLLHRLYEAELLASFIQNKKLKDVVYYSYWLNEWTVTLGILKRQKIVNKFISRAHGFDIYEERRADKTIPLRYFQLKMVDKVFSVSKMGQKYLINKNIFPQKIACSYLGVSDRGNNPYKEQVCFKIVSCSNLMPLKRVHLILEALKDITFPVEWVHFGDGEGNLLEQFKEKASKNLPSNVRFDFKGHIPNEEVLMYYKEHTVHLFVLLSESEGLPMSLIEACSFGIPLLATNVGGVPEIVSNKTGILVSADIRPIEVSEEIVKFRSSEKNTLKFRSGVRQFWMDNFKDSTNYNNFYNAIINH